MKLSHEQLAVIGEHIQKSDITIETLKDDLIDHLCCVVERKMDKGEDFETALQTALKELAPHGLDAIQLETFYLLNSPKIILMKKVIYSIGLISAVVLSVGWLFTVLRWPGGYELFNYGFLGFLLLFIPLLAIDRYKANLKNALCEKLKVVVGSVSGIVVGISLVFKFLHLQGADIIFIAGMLLFSFGFLPFLFFSMYRKAVS
jgi:hypothetical protein